MFRGDAFEELLYTLQKASSANADRLRYMHGGVFSCSGDTEDSDATACLERVFSHTSQRIEIP